MSTEQWTAIRLSLLVASTGVLCSLPPGIALGWLLARKRFAGKAILETVVNLPLVLPPVVTGFLLLVLFGRRGPIGAWLDEWFGLRIVFDWKGAALAGAVVSFPLLVRSIRIAFHSVDARLETVARSLGATPLAVFWTISLPLARHGVIAGSILAFARCLGEFGATIMIAGNIPGKTRTIPLYLYDQLETPNAMPQATGILLVSIAIAAAALFLGEWIERKSHRPFP